jgi:hypothetical protein
MLQPLRLACHPPARFVLPQAITAHPFCHQDNFNLRKLRVRRPHGAAPRSDKMLHQLCALAEGAAPT